MEFEIKELIEEENKKEKEEEEKIELDEKTQGEYLQYFERYRDLQKNKEDIENEINFIKETIFLKMESDKIDSFKHSIGTAYYVERVNYNKDKAIEYFEKNKPEAIEIKEVKEIKKVEETFIKLGKYPEIEISKSKTQQIRLKNGKEI
jgi:hypothetical protein